MPERQREERELLAACMASAEKEYFDPETSVSSVDPCRISLARTSTFIVLPIWDMVSHILFVKVAAVMRRHFSTSSLKLVGQILFFLWLLCVFYFFNVGVISYGAEP